MSSWGNLRLLRDTWGLSGSVSVCQGSVRAARGHFKAVRTIMCQYDYAFMCLRTLFCLTNISAPWYHTELVLYSKFAYGSQFSREKNVLKLRYLVVEILSKNGVLFFLGHPGWRIGRHPEPENLKLKTKFS